MLPGDRPCDKEWMQGDILAGEGFDALVSGTAHECAVVISHSCDLAAGDEKEPFAELLPCIITNAPPPNMSTNDRAGRGIRKLVLTLSDGRCLSLSIHDRKMIPKQDLNRYDKDPNLKIGELNLRKLQAWLAARYRRVALPDNVAHKLNPVLNAFVNEGHKNGRVEAILGVFMRYDKQEPDPGDFIFYIVYSVDRVDAKEIAEEYQEKIKTICEKTQKTHEDEGLEISCDVISDAELTLRDLSRIEELYLEYLSYRD